MRTDAAHILKALAGTDARTDRDWVARVAFHAGLGDKLIEPNYRLAGNGIERYCSLQGLEHSVRSYEHHLTHAAYACHTSPFDDAVCAVFDGYGEGVHSSYFHYRNGKVEPIRRARSAKGSTGRWPAWACTTATRSARCWASTSSTAKNGRSWAWRRMAS